MIYETVKKLIIRKIKQKLIKKQKNILKNKKVNNGSPKIIKQTLSRCKS